MNPPAPHSEFELTSLEMLGALSSRLIHDFKNKLAVISGNAHFASLSPDNPQRMATALAAIRRTSDEAAQFLERMAVLRRELGRHVEPSSAAELAQSLQRVMACEPAWEFRAPAELTGRVAIPLRWLRLIAWEIKADSRSSAGSAELDLASVPESEKPEPSLNEDLPPGDYCRIQLRHPLPAPGGQGAGGPVGAHTPHLTTVAARELVRRAGGVLQQSALDSGELLTTIYLVHHTG